jgi:hypothetical protein
MSFNMKKIWCNKTGSYKEAERFDIAFWRKAGPEARFAAMWECVKDFYKLKGKSGRKPRLQRFIQNIKYV